MRTFGPLKSGGQPSIAGLIKNRGALRGPLDLVGPGYLPMIAKKEEPCFSPASIDAGRSELARAKRGVIFSAQHGTYGPAGVSRPKGDVDRQDRSCL
jgi:hypothetical protein